MQKSTQLQIAVVTVVARSSKQCDDHNILWSGCGMLTGYWLLAARGCCSQDRQLVKNQKPN